MKIYIEIFSVEGPRVRLSSGYPQHSASKFILNVPPRNSLLPSLHSSHQDFFAAKHSSEQERDANSRKYWRSSGSEGLWCKSGVFHR